MTNYIAITKANCYIDCFDTFSVSHIMSAKRIYYPQLDVIRSIAVFSVFLGHTELSRVFVIKKTFIQLTGGQYGVEVFFVLSGYLITSILITELIETGQIKKRYFYKNRLLRLYPAIIVALILFVIPIYLFIGHTEGVSNAFFLLTYTGNFVPIFSHIFKQLQFPIFFGHTWTLALEEQFYLIYPFILTTAFSYYTVRRKDKNIINTFPVFNLMFLIALISCSVILRGQYYKFFLWRFFEIFFGSYLAFIYSPAYENQYPGQPITKRIKRAIHRIYHNRYIAWLSVLIFTTFVIYKAELPFNLNHYLITIAGSIFIIYSIRPGHITNRSILENKPLIYLGKISYGLYLFQYPILASIEYGYIKIPIETGNMFTKALIDDFICLLIILLISVLSYEFIEKRFLKFKRNRYAIRQLKNSMVKSHYS